MFSSHQEELVLLGFPVLAPIFPVGPGLGGLGSLRRKGSYILGGADLPNWLRTSFPVAWNFMARVGTVRKFRGTRCLIEFLTPIVLRMAQIKNWMSFQIIASR